MRHLARTLIHKGKLYLPAPLRRSLGAAYRNLHRRIYPSVGVEYLKAGAGVPLDRNTVFYETFHGSSANCSPLTIFQALISDPDYDHLSHVWSLKEPDAAPAALLNHPRVRLVQTGSVDHARILATAGVVMSNSTLPHWFARREGQLYVNTWHGVPLKRMFKHESAAHPTVHRNSQRNLLHSSHILLPNAFTVDTLMQSADVQEITQDRVKAIGAPRVDETLNTDRTALRSILGVRPDQHLVFVAPTWRGAFGRTDKSAPMLPALFDKLGQLDPERYVVFGQLHNYSSFELDGIRPVPGGISTNRFLAAVDTLVTDYSSIMFDFFPTGRPVVLYVYDRHEYEELRGLNFPLEDLPAQICYRPRDVVAAVKAEHPAREMPQYAAARDRYFPLEDGQATGRAIQAIFQTPLAPVPASRPRILFFGGGWLNNGITTSMLNLLTALSAYELDIYVLTEGLGLERSADALANLRRLPPEVNMIHRAGPMNDTYPNMRKWERFGSRQAFDDSTHEAAARAIMARECHRILGDARFDAAIDFSGYSPFWASVIANVDAKRHAIFQHNDLHSEAHNAQKAHGRLLTMFNAYKWYDRIVSVSEETRQVNLRNLERYYPAPEAAVAVSNMIEPARILSRAKEPMQRGLRLPQGDGPLFVMAGRLSPEKAVDRAIRAVARLRDEGQRVRLVAMGTGVLKDELERLIETLKLKDQVRLAGHVSNPFPVIAQGDCFLLSSDYEGQPMVLLEALTLGKPVIATDIPGARAVLGDSYGHLVSPDVEGLAEGMRRFIAGEVPDASGFDAEAYCEGALQSFFDTVLGFSPARRAEG